MVYLAHQEGKLISDQVLNTFQKENLHQFSKTFKLMQEL